MKSPKLVLASLALFMSLAAFSQVDTTKQKKDTTTKKDTAAAVTQEATSVAPVQEAQTVTSQPATTQQSTSTVPQSQPATAQQPATATTATEPVAAASKDLSPKPNFGRYYIPVLGSYQSGDSKSVTITGDESNPGKVWVEGLTPTKFYALLKAIPGTYKVPGQKVDDISIQEGTVLYDETTKQINICLGCGFQDKNPSEALTTTEEATTEPATKAATAKDKTKAKTTIVSFSGTKAEQGTASISQ